MNRLGRGRFESLDFVQPRSAFLHAIGRALQCSDSGVWWELAGEAALKAMHLSGEYTRAQIFATAARCFARAEAADATAARSFARAEVVDA